MVGFYFDKYKYKYKFVCNLRLLLYYMFREGEGKGDIIFPVAVGAMRNEAASPRVMKRYNELKLKLKRTVEELVTENKSLEKLKKKYKKRRDVYANYFTRNQPIITTTTDVSPISSCLEEKPVVVVPGSYTPFS